MPKLHEIRDAARKADEQRSGFTDHEQKAMHLIDRTVRGLIDHMGCEDGTWTKMAPRVAPGSKKCGEYVCKTSGSDFLFGVEFSLNSKPLRVPMTLSSTYTPPPLPNALDINDLSIFNNGVTTWQLTHLTREAIELPVEDDSAKLAEIYEDISLAVQSAAIGLWPAEGAHFTSFCEMAGLYKTMCTDKVKQHFDKGKLFPPCPACQQRVRWIMLNPA